MRWMPTSARPIVAACRRAGSVRRRFGTLVCLFAMACAPASAQSPEGHVPVSTRADDAQSAAAGRAVDVAGDRDDGTVPTPVGGFDASGMPRVDLSKIPPVNPREKYDTDRVMKLVIDPATRLPANPAVFHAVHKPNEIGAFRESCGYAGMNQDDALVFPGRPGASHLHTYFGVIADAKTTTAGILNAAWSTCAGGLLNRTAYWMPSVIDTRDGRPIKPKSNNAYYKSSYEFISKAAGAKDIVAVPEGLHLITGNAMNTDPTKAAGRFICLGPKGENPGWKKTITAAFADGTCVPGGDFVMEIDFPNCWDGVNLDSPDHKSHVVRTEAYPVARSAEQGGRTFSRRCPASHPKQLPTISYNVHYAIPDAQAVGRWFLSSDRNPACAGCSSHADYFFGWNKKIVETFTEHCLHEQRDCHNFLLGDNLTRLY